MSAGFRNRAMVIGAVIVSVGLHVAAAAVLASRAEEPVPGALAAGAAGLEIGLGSAGSNQLIREAIKGDPDVDADAGKLAKADTDVPQEKTEKAVKEPEPEAEPAPKPKPTPKPKPKPKLKPKPKPEPEPEPEPKPKPKADVRPVSEPKPVRRPQPEPVPAPSRETQSEPVADPVAPVAASTATSSADIKSPFATHGKPQAMRASTAGDGTASDKTRGGKKGDPNHYFSKLMVALNDAKRYPVESKKRKEEGVVTVAMEIGRSGVITASSVSKSSGHARLDQAALDMLARASPLPPVPDFIKQDPLRIVIPVEFSLITNSF